MKICEIIQGNKHHLVRPISWLVSNHPTQMKFNLQQPGWNSYGTNLRTETPGEPVTWAWFSLFMKPVIGVPPNVYEWKFMAQPKVTYKFPKWFSGFTLVKWLQAWFFQVCIHSELVGEVFSEYPMNPSKDESWSPSRQGVALHAAPQPQPMPTLTPGTRLRVEDREICSTENYKECVKSLWNMSSTLFLTGSNLRFQFAVLFLVIQFYHLTRFAPDTRM